MAFDRNSGKVADAVLAGGSAAGSSRSATELTIMLFTIDRAVG